MDRTGLFCSKPFEWLDVSVYPKRGSSYLCCPTWLPRSVGNLQDEDAQTLWNGPKAQEIRASIHDGSFRFCTKTCPFLKTVSGPVVPHAEIRDPRLRQIADAKSLVIEDGPKVVNAAFDRSCNLSCPSCRKEKLIESSHAQTIKILQTRIASNFGPGLELLYITGSGDAFGSPYFNRWLRRMQMETLPALAGIHVHTNGLLWTPRMWEKIPQRTRDRIRSCELSIDAANAQTYAENRRGGDFATLLDNASFIHSLRSEGPLEYVKVHMVVQANNMHEMPAFVELGQRFGADRVYFSHLSNWGTFTRENYRDRAVHLPSHPQHQELRSILNSPQLSQPHVDLGNLSLLAPPRPAPLAPAPTTHGMHVQALVG